VVEMIYADTNTFIRFFTSYPEEQSEIVNRFFLKVALREVELFVCDIVISEIVYVLERIYKVSRNEIYEKIHSILNMENIIIENRSVIVNALNYYKDKNINFNDAYIASHAIKNNINKVFTLDNDFKKIEEIKMVNEIFTKPKLN
jgi:predicted nucleic-acid-binding protein